MELLEMPATRVPQNEIVLGLEEDEMDRIVFELWQQGSLPEPAANIEAEVDEVASHASCL